MNHAPSFGIWERPQQADMFQEHGGAAFSVRDHTAGPCSLCAAPAVGECDYEGRTIRVCEEHHDGAWRMVKES